MSVSVSMTDTDEHNILEQVLVADNTSERQNMNTPVAVDVHNPLQGDRL